jgi:glycogen(starch) synthase
MTDRPLKVLYLSIEYPPESPNGIGSYVAETAAAVAALGHQVHVLSCIPGQEPRDYLDGDVRIHRRGERGYGLGRVIRGRYTAVRVQHAAACWREARKLEIDWDVVESPDWMAEGLLLALRGAPVVAQLHTPLAVTRGYGGRPFTRDVRAAAWLERLVVEHARQVASPSQLILDELSSAGWRNLESAAIIRLAIDLARWSETIPIRETRPIVLFSGRLEHLKAPDVLVDAASRLKDVDTFEVWLAGRSGGVVDGRPYDEWLRGRIAALGVPCRLLGQVSREKIRRLGQEARVVALPSRYENMPYAALEAMAAGRPVVCTSNTGLAEIVDGSAGGVVPPGDAEALAEALRPLLVDPDAAARAGARARELVERECAPSRVAERREHLYRQVAEAGRPRRRFRR